jgi:hypothetical protein
LLPAALRSAKSRPISIGGTGVPTVRVLTQRQTGRRRAPASSLNATRRLVRLSDAGFALSQPNDDIRGRIVVDKNRYGIGTVEDLLIDASSRRAILMIVKGSDILLGDKNPLIPVDAIRRGDGDYVFVGQDHESVAEAPGFEPDRLSDRRYIAAVYRWYGLMPYWHPDYVYPSEWSQRLGGAMRGLRPRR